MTLTRRLPRRWGAATAAILLAGSVLAGCGRHPAAGPAPSERPQAGGTIVYAAPPETDINWYLPLAGTEFNSLYNFQLIYQLYKPLIWINHQYQVNWATSVARAVTWNPQGTVYHIFLHRRWHWSDGRPVTSRNVLFTWEVLRAASNRHAPAPWPYADTGMGGLPGNIRRVTADGPYELTITLKQPVNQEWFLYNGIAQLTPMPAAAWDRYPRDMTRELAYLGQNGTNPGFDRVVDGPYRLTRAVDKQSWTLSPNPSYDGHKALATIVLTYEASDAAEFAALKSGAAQVGSLDPTQWGARAQLTHDRVRPAYPFAFFGVELNMNPSDPGGLGPVFRRLYVRQALEMGIDQAAIDRLWHGFAPPQYGPVPTIPRTAFLAPGLNHPLYPFDPARGQALLEQHGWRDVHGVMTRRGVRLAFTLLVPAGSGILTQDAELLKADWAREGVQVTLRPEPFADITAAIGNPKASWSAAVGQGIVYGGSYPTGGEMFSSRGGMNTYGYADPVMDRLIARTHQPAATPAAALQAFQAYERYAARQLPMLWINNAVTLSVVADNVHNAYHYFNYLVGFPRMQYWWIAR
ncbi:SBP_bac_5 domain-containing protein [Candidatus Hydrogenisulfobacillus filiaventi]|uniref:SBP_bac_5 domain-containing protein n=1 Tax=Candidatus Hydrogenisulfobacillus filiaventi TaxID=2707344 RepID=A0A6F8ZFL5_9FIRM|nr:SBP_bac_5 domain-containing protein [Candidatus Hydrogenisulfobacillus filiaventi]